MNCRALALGFSLTPPLFGRPRTESILVCASLTAAAQGVDYSPTSTAFLALPANRSAVSTASSTASSARERIFRSRLRPSSIAEERRDRPLSIASRLDSIASFARRRPSRVRRLRYWRVSAPLAGAKRSATAAPAAAPRTNAPRAGAPDEVLRVNSSIRIAS